MNNDIDNSILFFLIFRNKYLKNKILFDLKLFNNHNKVKLFIKDKPFKCHRFYNYLLNIEINFPITLNNFKHIHWPPFLEVLKFGDNIKTIDNEILRNIATQCRSLKQLSFDSLIQDLGEGTLGNSIQVLGLSKYACKSLPVELSSLYQLKSLYLGSVFNAPIYNLPTSLTILSFGYNSSMETSSSPFDISNYSSFNYPIHFVKCLPNLTYLNTGTMFNQIITPGSISNGKLSTLILGLRFHNSIIEGTLPDTLTSFGLLNEKYGLYFDNSSLPSSIKCLSLGTNQFNSNLITPNITTLKLLTYHWPTPLPTQSINTLVCYSISQGFQLKYLSDSITKLYVDSFDYNLLKRDIDYDKYKNKIFIIN